MLQLSKNFINQPVMSLRTGGQVGVILRPIINPNNLKIEGFYCSHKAGNRTAVLLTQDIRDIIRQGFVIDDAEVLADPAELVRLQRVLEINFRLDGKPVVTDSKHKVGKIVDWAAETTTFYIQKLYAGRSVLKSLNQGQLSIDRSQIVEITDKKIIIQDIVKPGTANATANASLA